MKKIVAIIALSSLLLLSGCGSQADTTADKTVSENGTVAQTVSETSSTPETVVENKISSVTNTASSTPETVIVPDVVGLNKNDAVEKLKKLGLKVAFTKEPGYSANKPENTILTQSIDKDMVVAYGAEIELQYNSLEFRFVFREHKDDVSIFGFYGTPSTDTITIPSSYNGKPVTILLCGLNFDENVKEIYIPNSVSQIIDDITSKNKAFKIIIDNSKDKIFFFDDGCNVEYLR